MNEMRGLFLVVLLLLFLIPFVSADILEGCFLLPESSFYCQNILVSSAREECSFAPGCVLETVFSEGTDCNDHTLFPQCQEVLCKSSCRPQLAGKCLSGAVPEGEEQKWCSPGCCQYIAGSTFCGPVDSKWNCEAQAYNRNATQYRFALLESAECVSLCQRNATAFPVEHVSVSGTAAGKGIARWWWVIVSFIVVIVLLIAWLQLKRFFAAAPAPTRDNYLPRKWYSFFTSNPRARARVQKLQWQHTLLVREKEREDFLSAFGLTPAVIHSEFPKLQRLIQRQERMVQEPSPAELFRKLESLTAKVPGAKARSLQDTTASEREKILAEVKMLVSGKQK